MITLRLDSQLFPNFLFHIPFFSPNLVLHLSVTSFRHITMELGSSLLLQTFYYHVRTLSSWMATIGFRNLTDEYNHKKLDSTWAEVSKGGGVPLSLTVTIVLYQVVIKLIWMWYLVLRAAHTRIPIIINVSSPPGPAFRALVICMAVIVYIATTF